MIGGKDLIFNDSLSFQSSDTLFISRIKDFVYWKEKILISDLDFKKVWIFDKELNYETYIGREGKGPNEFISVPDIVPFKDSLYLFDYQLQRASVYDDKFNFIKTLKYPKGYIIYPQIPVTFDNRIAISGSQPFTPDMQDYFDLNSILLLDTKLNYVDDIIKWDDYYKKGTAYGTFNMQSMISPGKNSSFYSVQMATQVFNHIDKNGNFIKKFFYKPTYFKTPPPTKIEEVASSFDATAEFGSSVTRYFKMNYEKKNDFLLVNYVNLDKSSWYERSFLLGQHYLMAFNSDYNCIIDTVVPGPLAFTNNGYIYILKDESPDNIVLYKYTIINEK